MSKQYLELKPIIDLLEYNFYVPSYQRGYRWNDRQVLDLLDDIDEFAYDMEKEDFYCLQPVVVTNNVWKDKKQNNISGYNIIDGQQRLTTIFLILKLFNEVEFKRPKKTYSLFFETREEDDNSSRNFLKKLTLGQDVSNKNIDFYYFSNNYKIIWKWFENKLKNEEDYIQRIYPVLVNNIKVIWYDVEVDDITKEIDIFTRLNIGKIPLTNSELIKALFLLDKVKSKNDDKSILATQWDNIEYTLQDNVFFAFINGDVNSYKKPTRIEFIFDLIAANLSLSIENLKNEDERYSYYVFDKLLKDDESFKRNFHIKENYDYDKKVDYLWDKIKTYFRIFEEFFYDNTYYHLVGYLVNNGIDINDILQNFDEKNKDDFLEYLKEQISKLIKLPKNKNFKQINYKEDYRLITKILFLFNVVSTMEIGYSKYPFDLHKRQNWSLEHIHAQNSEDIKQDSDRKLLLEDQKKYIYDKNLINKINKLLSNEQINDEEFDSLQNMIFELYTDNISVHTIDNMALLSGKDNSALNNSIFPSKRDKIKELDKNGSFIPIGTKNVFLKYYSSNVKESIKWNQEDRKKYLYAIVSTLNKCKRLKYE